MRGGSSGAESKIAVHERVATGGTKKQGNEWGGGEGEGATWVKAESKRYKAQNQE